MELVVRSLLIPSLLGLSAFSFAAEPAPTTADIFPTNGQKVKVLDTNLSVTDKSQIVRRDEFDGFTGFSSAYLPKFYYIHKTQKLNFPGFVVTKAPLVQEKEGKDILYRFEGHAEFPDIVKFARMEILKTTKGICQMTWTLKNTLRSEIQDQANGSVEYACRKKQPADKPLVGMASSPVGAKN